MTITVLMTTHNCAAYISQAIKSILNQTYKDFEFLIIDDGSIDHTEEIVSSFSDNRIIYKKIEHSGLSKALNIGLDYASNEIIARMDADDIAHPKRFEYQISALTGNKSEIVFVNVGFFYKYKVKYILINPTNKDSLLKKLALHGHLSHPSAMYYKSHILSFGGYNEEIDVFEDYDLWLRIKDRSEFVFVNKILLFQRFRIESLSNSTKINLNDKFYKIQKPYYYDLNKSFNIDGFLGQTMLKAWREFFYGEKKLARYYWKQINFSDLNYRVLIAYILTFLPENIFSWFKKKRFRLRLQYLVQRFSAYKGLDKEFKNLLKEVT